MALVLTVTDSVAYRLPQRKMVGRRRNMQETSGQERHTDQDVEGEQPPEPTPQRELAN